jgi:ferredoxin
MKAIVDRGKCIGAGMCTTIAPSLFELDNEGALVVLSEQPATDEERALLDAVACCPVSALSTTDE